jgi:NAD(P)H-hydrate epimerase
VIPVLSSEEMKAVDQAAPEPVEVLVGRAGQAVAHAALRLLGGAYGRRVVVVVGKGNNGADGRAAAARLARRGARVVIVEAAAAPPRLPPADLVIDAAYGTGFRGRYTTPDPAGAPVLAVDIPSGLAGDTGLPGDGGSAVQATATVTFAAYKPGLLLGEGPERAGPIELVDIGLESLARERATTWLVEDGDAGRWLPARSRNTHKWKTAVAVIAGSPGMMGAPNLVARAAMRTGSGYVRLGVPGASLASIPAGEAVALGLPASGWDGPAVEAMERCRAAVIGPGLGRSGTVRAALLRVLAGADLPTVVDADGLNALGSAETLATITKERSTAVVITPHDGEYSRLFGEPAGADRLRSVRSAAAATGAVVLLKGSSTVIASPDGTSLLAAAGSSRLATAGTGDVLSGMIGALLARGIPALEAAGLAAHVHGRAAGLGFAEGLVAGDLPDLVARWLSEIRI